MYEQDTESNSIGIKKRARITKPDLVELKKLTNHFGLAEWSGEIFLNELKLSTEPGDQKAKDLATSLNLL